MRAIPSIRSAAVGTLLLACSDTNGPSDSAPTLPRPPGAQEAVSFQVAPASATLRHGQTLQFTTTYSGNPALSNGTTSVAWHSSDESVATVSPNGLVRGVTGGKTRVVATWGGYQASAIITVVGPMKKHNGPAVY